MQPIKPAATIAKPITATRISAIIGSFLHEWRNLTIVLYYSLWYSQLKKVEAYLWTSQNITTKNSIKPLQFNGLRKKIVSCASAGLIITLCSPTQKSPSGGRLHGSDGRP